MVTAQYAIVGEICGYSDLFLEDKSVEITYRLRKVGEFWKIYFPDQGQIISLQTAYRLVQTAMNRHFFKNIPSKQRAARRSLEILKSLKSKGETVNCQKSRRGG
jgi:hypothetical protein